MNAGLLDVEGPSVATTASITSPTLPCPTPRRIQTGKAPLLITGRCPQCGSSSVTDEWGGQMFGTVAVLVLIGVPASLTTLGSHRRGNDIARCIAEGLAWPVTWIHWFVTDNLAAGRGPFKGK